jgi:hypothetical protein
MTAHLYLATLDGVELSPPRVYAPRGLVCPRCGGEWSDRECLGIHLAHCPERPKSNPGRVLAVVVGGGILVGAMFLAAALVYARSVQ